MPNDPADLHWQPAGSEGLNFGWGTDHPIEPRQLGAVDWDISDFLDARERDLYAAEYDAYANKHPWGRMLEVTIRRTNRRVRLVVLCAEGVKMYMGFFAANDRAPGFLFLKDVYRGMGGHFTDFYRWEKALGQAVHRYHPRPGQVGVDEPNVARGHYNWPWGEEVDSIDGIRVFRRPPDNE